MISTLFAPPQWCACSDVHALVDLMGMGAAPSSSSLPPAAAAKLTRERLAMCLAVGSAWAGLEQHEKAEVVLSVAQRAVHRVLEQVAAASAASATSQSQGAAQSPADQKDVLTLVFDLLTLRAAVSG